MRLAHFSVQEYLCSGKTRNIDAKPSFYLPATLGHFEIGMQCVKELFRLDEPLQYCSSTLESDDEPDSEPDDESDAGPDPEPDDEPDNRSIRSLLDQHETASNVEHSESSTSLNTNHSSRYATINSFIQTVLDLSPLLAYSIIHWAEHAKHVQPADTETRALVNSINRFFSKEASLCYATYLRCCRTDYFDALDRYSMEKRIPPIGFASSHGLIDNVFELIQQQVNVNEIDPDSGLGTALSTASAKGHVKIVQLLLESGADVNQNRIDLRSAYCSALTAASAGGHINIVQLLLESGADVNLKSEGPYSRYGIALAAASINGHTNVVRLLLESRANVNLISEIPDFWDETNISSVHSTALVAASAKGHVDIVQLLLESGADVNLHAPYQFKPLQAACQGSQDEVVPYLLKAGAEVDFVSDRALYKHKTALQIVCRLGRFGEKGQKIVIAALLDGGATVNLQVRRGPTALQVACNSGHAGNVAQLLNAGADPNLTGRDENSPLVLAVQWEDYEMMDQLLKAGADPNSQDRSDRTPLWHARQSDDSGKDRMIQMLLAAGATDIDASHYEEVNIPRSYTSSRSVGSRASSAASSDVEDQNS